MIVCLSNKIYSFSTASVRDGSGSFVKQKLWFCGRGKATKELLPQPNKTQFLQANYSGQPGSNAINKNIGRV
jgi:hypothetical protein